MDLSFGWIFELGGTWVQGSGEDRKRWESVLHLSALQVQSGQQPVPGDPGGVEGISEELKYVAVNLSAAWSSDAKGLQCSSPFGKAMLVRPRRLLSTVWRSGRGCCG